jgi:D-alanyl-D-alanine carboxypeptidase (penicillin-binding protein 5/6)
MRSTRAATAAAVALVLAWAPQAHAQRPPEISAPSAIVVEASTGDVVFERAASQRRSIASATKLMTALVALEVVALDDVLTAPPYAAAPAESVIGLRAGERLSVRDLMRGLLLASGNDAAVTLATGVSGSLPAFVREMNQRARALGLKDTRFTNPVGLDQGDNRSSARDLVRLGLELRRNDFFREVANLPRATLRTGDRRRTVLNRNRLVSSVPYVNGLKTGYTAEAGYVLVGSATRNGVTVVSAVLGAPSEAARDADTRKLLDFGLSRYRLATVVGPDAVFGRAEVKYTDNSVELVAGEPVRQVLRRGEQATVRVIGAPGEVEGPVQQGTRVGRVDVLVRGRTVARSPLVIASPVPKASLSDRLATVLGRPSSLACWWSSWGVPCRSCCCADGSSVGQEGCARDHHGHPERGDRQDAVGAELPARPAPSHGRADDHGRRQGREHRPLAEVARPAGDRHRLRRRAHGDAHRRAAHRRVDPQRLRADPRGVADQHGGARPDDRRADGDQRARAGRHGNEMELFLGKARLPRPRRGDRRAGRLAAPAGSTPTTTRRSCASCASST